MWRNRLKIVPEILKPSQDQNVLSACLFSFTSVCGGFELCFLFLSCLMFLLMKLIVNNWTQAELSHRRGRPKSREIWMGALCSFNDLATEQG